MKKIAIFITFLGSLILIPSCNKEATEEEQFANLEKTYKVSISKTVKKIYSNEPTTSVNSVAELESLIKSNVTLIKASVVNSKKKDDLKISMYQYGDGEVGGGSQSTSFYAGEFAYANPLGTPIFYVHPYYSFNNYTQQFSNFGAYTTGNTGQYSTTVNSTSWENLGTYHRQYHYYVSITRTIVYSGFPLSYTWQQHYVMTVNRVTGALIGVGLVP